MRQHKHILLLAKTLSFTKAAQQAHLSQSAFSKSVASFEKQLGVKIFSRTTSSVTVTDVGVRVIKEIENLLFEIDSFEKKITNIKSGEFASISFGSGPYPAKFLLKKTIKEFHKENPNISLDIKIDYWGNLLKKLNSSDIDFFIADIRSIGKTDNLDIIPIGGLTLAVFCDPSHPLVNKKNNSLIGPDELSKYRFSSVSLPSIVTNELKSALNLSYNHSFDFLFICDDMYFITDIIQGTEILCISSNYMMEDLIKKGKIKKVNVKMKKNRFGLWGLVKIKNRELAPASAKLANILIEHIRTGSLYDQKKYGLPSNDKLNFL